MEDMVQMYDEMKRNINKAGGLFYQYRPCRRDMETIYDIENIRHGVVYAQTPLNMNDPFDSMIGFSSKEIFYECISMLLDILNIEDKNMRDVMEVILKYRLTDDVSTLLNHLIDIKSYIKKKRIIMHKVSVPLNSFVTLNLKSLYGECDKNIKKKFSVGEFYVLSLMACELEMDDISDDDLSNLFNLKEPLETLQKAIIETKENVYTPEFKKFLSKITVTCFSSSGWNNQLMWSHYANSYSGICIEYDFNKIDEFIGFIYPVKYTKHRLVMSLKDIGIEYFYLDGEVKPKNCDPNMKNIISYMLAKNECWKYECEWRIINVGEPNTPVFIDLPFIKSITVGMNIDPICKYLLLDVCEEKNIECYQIETETDSFMINRRKLDKNEFSPSLNEEVEYIKILLYQMNNMFSKIGSVGNADEGEENAFDSTKIQLMFGTSIDALTNAYFFKKSLNRICENSDEELSKEDVTEEMRNAIVELEEFIDTVDTAMKTFEQAIPGLIFSGVVSESDRKIILKQKDDILRLVDKYRQVEWNDILLTDETSEDTNS